MAAPEVAHGGMPGESGGEAFVAQLIDGQAVMCELTAERRDGQDIAAALIKAGLTRECRRYPDGRYAALEVPPSRKLPLPA